MRKAGHFRTHAILGVLLLLPVATLPAQQTYRLGPAENWVQLRKPDVGVPLPTEAVTGGYELLLVDAQDRIGPGTADRYRHIAYRLLDQSAVTEHSEIELSWDPTYEELTLHSAAVIRDGQVINQLKSSRIRVVQRESSRDYHIYDGRLTAVLVLEDVRSGDAIDYSYTRRGSNPVFAGHYTAAVSQQQSVPVRERRFRLLWPRARQLYIKAHQTTVEPVVTENGAFREYTWEAKDLAPRVADPDTPSWFDPYPWIQLSDFADWRAVAAWGDTLFSAPGALPPALARQIATIRAEHSSQDAQALAALRYVQDKVRYLGVEIGVNSHRPYPVATVLQRGYGDCKDKVQLLLAMLKELGIESRPALVSTAYRDQIRALHPTSADFDHAIVQLVVNGETHWVDPTSTKEGGDLRSASAQLGAALVLGPDRDAITTIPPEPMAARRTEIGATFSLGGVDQPAVLRVDTDYRGSAAVETRATTGTTSIAQLSRDYLKFYGSYYPGIEADGVPVIEDNRATNLLHITERYTIPGFWETDAEGPGHTGTLSPLELYNTIPSVTSSRRTMPLAIDHPTSVRYVMTANLKEGWGITPRVDSVRTPALRFVRDIEVDGQTLRITYDYETLADHVEPADVPLHMKELGRLRDLIGYHVTPPPANPGGPSWTTPGEINWPIAWLALGVI
ncbi:MAG TPA: DUF3857 domain-containing transglutaminase family protein, partial [Gemmatimonadales bacterium]|nr:DUF3857 domain-containing transglutaminase family protein [Gemmatimonadales bacterium]